MKQRNKIVRYKDLNWYLIKEDEKERILFLKDSFTNEMIQKYFTRHDNDYDVQFNKDYSNPWWRDSYIRMILNSKFLEDLDINDLNVMETTIELNNEKVTTRDYVRLLTKEEAKELSKEILKTEREYGYWAMSPFYFYNGSAYVFRVWGAGSVPGYLNGYRVTNSFAVRPVISLKSSVLVSEVNDNIADTLDCEENIEEIDRKATNKELADKLNELIRDRNARVKKERELKENE